MTILGFVPRLQSVLTVLGLFMCLLGGAVRAAGQETPEDQIYNNPPSTCWIQASDGNLYSQGSVIYLSSGLLGAFPLPSCNFIQGTNSDFYSWTSTTVTQVTMAGIASSLYTFSPDDGSNISALIEGTDGNFYGVAESGGADNYGTLFRLSPGGTFTLLHEFTNGADGASPTSLVQGSDGNLYGAGSYFFRSTLAGSFTTLGIDGVPSPIIEGPGGLFYGLAGGTPYSISTSGTLTNLLPDGDGGDGGYPLEGPCYMDGTPALYCSALYFDEYMNNDNDDQQLVEVPLSGGALVTYAIFGANWVMDGEFDITYTLSGSGFYGTFSGGGYNYQCTNDFCAWDYVYAYPSDGYGSVAPMSISVSPEYLYAAKPATLTWKVLNAYSDTMQLCFASGSWSGTKATSGTASITAPSTPGIYQYGLTCGGVETIIADLNVLSTLTITTTSVPSGTFNASYATAISVTGGLPSYTWSISSGSLPPGLYLGSGNGYISGTPSEVGSFPFTVTVVDALGNTASAEFSITISPPPPPPPPPLTLTTLALGTGAEGVAYPEELTATGGVPPYAWSVSAGSLPAGLALNATTGAISGKPTTAATSSFTASVIDSASDTASENLSITVNPATTVRITTATLPDATVARAYSQTLAATSGTKPYTWSIASGSLPAGLSLASSTGVISGSATTAGTFGFLVEVEGSGKLDGTAWLFITVNPEVAVATTLLPTAAVGTEYSATLAASGGLAPYKWNFESGTLPAGLSISAAGVISGKPTTAATSSFLVEVTDAQGNTAVGSESVTVYSASIVRITTTSLPNGAIGTPYSATLEATSGTKPYTWSVYSGGLPPGLTVDPSTGVISGTPNATGTYNFFIGVKGSGNNTATASLSITIAQ